MSKITEHFTWEEFTLSQVAVRKGLDNSIPNKKIKLNIIALVEEVLEPLRRFIDAPIIITSGYRSLKLNKAIGGSVNSQHTKGEAADIITPTMENRRLFKDIISAWQDNIIRGFDQLIWEFGDEHNPAWIHISYKRNFNKNRFEILRALKSKEGLTLYKQVDMYDILNELF